MGGSAIDPAPGNIFYNLREVIIGIVFPPFHENTIMKYVCLASLLFLLSCQSPSGSHSGHDSSVAVAAVSLTPDSTTLGGTWFLQPVLPTDTGAGKTPCLQFDVVKSHFSGNTGCNSMRGSFWFSKNDSSLSFSDKITTSRMACQGYNEGAFIKSLQHATHFRLRNGVLSLVADDNTELSRWMRKPTAPAKAIKA
jgi:heat shock protein HslJ